MLTLYDYPRSSASYRVRIALELKGLEYQTTQVHLVNDGGEQHYDTYRHLNPQALVPTLQDEALVISQSLAIIEYLEEIAPQPALLPSGAEQRAKVRQFVYAIACDTHPLNNLRVLQYLQAELCVEDEAKLAWYRHWVSLGLIALEALATSPEHAEPHRSMLFGDSPTLAELCLVPQLYNARRFECPLEKYPRLLEVEAACQELPAFQSAAP